MVQRLLIANRGEIALRIMRSARVRGMECVVVHADSDRTARHVREADLALSLGGSTARESYLSIDRVLAAAERAAADAVHPGYGFLSENASFAEAVTNAGMTFVGPPASVIQSMGSKETAKQLAIEAGVPVIPGSEGALTDPAALRALAAELPFPLLIKAALGGGGRGLRRVDEPAAFDAALASAQREALAAFGDDAMLLERFLDGCRHVEVQVLADGHGTVRHLFDRDCSLQRRHQKIIEEAPAFGLAPPLRQRMLDDAVRLAQHIGYQNAGTVEFAVLGDEYFFLEMNTRLQVEHPVTEAVTGIDLVDWQLRIAAGEAIDFEQASVACCGHAMEARIYAEDPTARFLPSVGTVERLQWPGDARIDSGVDAGDTVTQYFDPMIAKVIASGADRELARTQLRQALAATRVAGITTNCGYLGALLERDDFGAGTHHTTAIDGWLPESRVGEQAAALAASMLTGAADSKDAWSLRDGFRLNQRARVRRRWLLAGATVQIEREGDRLQVAAAVDPENAVHHEISDLGSRSGPDGLETLDFVLDGVSYRADRWVAAGGCTVWLRGQCWRFLPVPIPLPQSLAASGSPEVRAPMAGQLVDLRVAVGDSVAVDEVVAVLEAMKMEHELRAPAAGRVAEVLAAPGDAVAADALLVTLDQE